MAMSRYEWGRVQPGVERIRAGIAPVREQVLSADGGLPTCRDYLERHIEVDSEQHTPTAMQMLADLCGDDRDMRDECVAAVQGALAARIVLWDGISAALAATAPEPRDASLMR
jgi:hypothetical protein